MMTKNRKHLHHLHKLVNTFPRVSIFSNQLKLFTEKSP